MRHSGLDIPGLLAFEDLGSVGGRVAFRFRIGPEEEHRDYTYAALRDRVAARADALAAVGCASGDRVALLLPHTELLVTTFFGALYGGMIPSIVAWPTAKMDSEKYRRNVAAVVANLKAEWLVTEPEMARELGGHLGPTRVVDARDIRSAAGAGGVRAPSPRRDGLAFIQFSGGTTGTQKSVGIPFAHLTRQLESYAAALELTDRDGIVSWLPLYHDMGLVACLVMPFVFRLPATLFAPMEWVMDPRPFLESIGADRTTLCWLPNFAYAFMASKVAPEEGEYDLSSLRGVINCSEPVRDESMRAFAERFRSSGLRPEALHCCYAMAEATFAVTQTSARVPPARLRTSPASLGAGRVVPDADGARVLVSCGLPIADVEVRVVRPGGGAPADAAEGEIGEIWLRGPFIMEDYLDAAGRGTRPFTEGWYRTGDLGTLVAGHLYVTGRAKDIIIVGGVNVYPEDVELAVSGVEGIHPGRAVAVGIVDETIGTERLVVVAEANALADLERAQRIELAARAAVVATCGIAPYRTFIVEPKWIVKSTAGKISRIETRQRLLERWKQLDPGTAP